MAVLKKEATERNAGRKKGSSSSSS